MRLQEQLKERLAQRRLSHACIVTGETRAELADYLAAYYLCSGETTPPCGQCTHCRKAAAGIHPDLIRIGTEGVTIKVEEIRALRSDAYIRPNEAARKVYLIPQAETLNQSSQNVLLKLLEEGPEYAAFLFLTPNPECLLPTVRSRCELLRAESEETVQAVHTDAELFLTLLLDGDALSLATFAIAQEKKSREELSLLFDETLVRLVGRLPQEPAKLLPLIDRLRHIRAACEYNVGVGHLTGWMMALL